MKQITIVMVLLCISQITFAQVGIGTTNPEGALDIVATDQGIVVPRVSALKNVTTPDGSQAVDGTIVYDLSRNQMCSRISGAWICTNVTGQTTMIIPGEFENISNYIKASNTSFGDAFGISLDLSADGNTLVVGASDEDSNATGINGNQADNSAISTGAVYVYTRSGAMWVFEAYIKASNTDANDFFGSTVSINSDGTLIAVGAPAESSNATGINGDETNNSINSTGAVYLFNKSGGVWSQEAYIKASNPSISAFFGTAIALSDDGTRLAVGANGENSNATGVNGDQTNNTSPISGAVYVFLRTSGVWSQEAYIKASNTNTGDSFGQSLDLNSNGSYLIVGATDEDSNATGVNGNDFDNSASGAGAAYVFIRSGATWTQDAYLKASNTGTSDGFGRSLSINGDGTTVAIGADDEDSNATGVGGDQTGGFSLNSGAVYIFSNNGTAWTQTAYIKASNTGVFDRFGIKTVLSQDGGTLLVSAQSERSNATGINGDQTDNSAQVSGAVYSFTKLGNEWIQSSYIKASNTNTGDRFGSALALNLDGSLAIIGAIGEDSNATGVGGDQTNNNAPSSGAVYVVE